MSDRRNIAGLVLAGGAGRRMGGANKALLPLAGRPLIAHAVERLAPQVASIAISANRDADRLAAFDLPILPDHDPRLLGPLAGILAGLRWAEGHGYSHLATAAADTPFPPVDLVERLAERLAEGQTGIALASSGGRIHPVFGLWPVALCDVLAAHLDQSEDRSVMAFARAQGMHEVEFDIEGGRDPFFNVNTPDDLAQVHRLIGERDG
ncbi:MAG: molybdenum cofactor guanylyltransferase MobA [Mesorhizobium sp.]|nr:molybdenum cofactor guanylyltransferase MobA [Mesorhizobium sp.]